MAPEITALDTATKYRLPRIRLCLVNESDKGAEMHAIRSPEDVANFLEPIRNLAEEHFVTLHLNSRHEVIGLHEVSHGTLSASLVHPREVFKAALLTNSHAILVCHNHPSGSSISPSPEDIDTTQQLLKSGKLLGIGVLDHVIVSPVHDMYSLRENHPDIWDE